MIEVRNLTKKYGDHFAVNGISFDIEDGKIYGFLGPNGAGKSTTMNIITGCLSATSGSVLIDGKDIFTEPIEAKKKIGYLPELPPLYTDMTVSEYLAFIAEAKGVSYELSLRQINEAMELTQITGVSERLIRNLSKGYRQRVGIAQAIIGNPDILILDEPTVGLDPKQIIGIRELIRNLGQTKTVIVSSHILAEISAVCDHVMILSHGNLVANDTIANLEESVSSLHKMMLSVKGDAADAIKTLSDVDGVNTVNELDCHTDGIHRFAVEFLEENDPREAIFRAFAATDLPILEMATERATLEDIFLRLTNDDIAAVPDEEEKEEEEEEEEEEVEETGTDTNVDDEAEVDADVPEQESEASKE